MEVPWTYQFFFLNYKGSLRSQELGYQVLQIQPYLWLAQVISSHVDSSHILCRFFSKFWEGEKSLKVMLRWEGTVLELTWVLVCLSSYSWSAHLGAWKAAACSVFYCDHIFPVLFGKMASKRNLRSMGWQCEEPGTSYSVKNNRKYIFLGEIRHMAAPQTPGFPTGEGLVVALRCSSGMMFSPRTVPSAVSCLTSVWLFHKG